MSTADAASVFIVGPITDVMATVFNGPMASVVLQYLLSRCQGRRFTGDAIGNIGVFLATLFVSGEPFHHKGLPDMREVQIGVELGGHPDFADFETAMVPIDGRERGRLIKVFKIEGCVFQQMFLVAFDGEVVVGVGPALFHEIAGQLALREQGIGADGLAADLDGVQQRDGRFDFIGLLLLVAPFYRQRAYFFGV